MRVHVGNDVVDLGAPRTEGLARDQRFVRRVFAPEEIAALRAAPELDLEVWTRWAAKESAYKALSKLVGTAPPFIHRAYVARWSTAHRSPGAGPEGLVREGVVRWGELEADVRVSLRAGGVHAVAWALDDGPPPVLNVTPTVALLDEPGAPWTGPLEQLLRRFSLREAEAVHSRASAAVRIGARAELARLLGVAEERIEIVCEPGTLTRRPPRVLIDGEPAPADVSLSHDGRWIAWAVWVAEPCEAPA